MSESVSPPLKDRSTGLLIFGILLIVLGGCSALMVLFLVVTVLFQSAEAARTTLQLRGMWTGIIMYVCAAVAFIWLGIGSIKARRWARALLVIASSAGLIWGILSMIGMLFFLPRVFASTGENLSPGLSSALMAFVLVFNGILFVAIPGILVAFYARRDVRATCEARDPVIRWTDHCPLPVLCAALWAGFLAFSFLSAIPTGLAFIPVFGWAWIGWPAVAGSAALALFWIWAARGFYRLDFRAWWGSLILIVLSGISSALTYQHYDLTQIYRLMGLAETDLAEISKLGLSHSMSPLDLLWKLVIIGYLLYLRRYFRRDVLR